jgi:hypothetical protein
MVRSAGNRVHASHRGAAARADSCHVSAIDSGFTAVLTAVVTVRWCAGAALAVQALTVGSDLAGLVEDTSGAGTSAINIRF